MHQRLGYRAELDGLRGVAIALVVVYHLLPQTFPGGNLGVDMFFVLSGFLITTLLVEEHNSTGAVSKGAFYRRRARRLIPALVAVCAAACGLAALGAGPGRGSDTLHALPAVMLYASNWSQAGGWSGGLLSHTWSLAIEEQFYLIWPVVFVAVVARLRCRATWCIVGAITFGAWRAFLMFQGTNPQRLYVGTDTRADSLLFGCALAFALPYWRSTRWTRLAGCLGVLALLWSVFRTHQDGQLLMMGGYSVVAASVTLIIFEALVREGSLFGRVLRFQPLVALGRISYGVYLWHYVFWQTSPLVKGAVAASALWVPPLTLVAAFLSYRYVEAPFLRHRSPTGTAPALLAGASL